MIVLEIVTLVSAARLLRILVPTGVSAVVMVLSVERYQRRVVAAGETVPVFLTVAVKVIVLERATLFVLALRAVTMRSGEAPIVATLVKGS